MNRSGRYKSKIIALLLLAFFGAFGAHQFYLGSRAAGIIQLVLTVLGGLTAGAMVMTPDDAVLMLVAIWCLFAVQIWLFIDFIRILVVDEDDFGWRLER